MLQEYWEWFLRRVRRLSVKPVLVRYIFDILQEQGDILHIVYSSLGLIEAPPLPISTTGKPAFIRKKCRHLHTTLLGTSTRTPV